MKKWIIGLSSLAAAAAPLAVVVSCGSKDAKKTVVHHAPTVQTVGADNGANTHTGSTSTLTVEQKVDALIAEHDDMDVSDEMLEFTQTFINKLSNTSPRWFSLRQMANLDFESIKSIGNEDKKMKFLVDLLKNVKATLAGAETYKVSYIMEQDITSEKEKAVKAEVASYMSAPTELTDSILELGQAYINMLPGDETGSSRDIANGDFVKIKAMTDVAAKKDKFVEMLNAVKTYLGSWTAEKYETVFSA